MSLEAFNGLITALWVIASAIAIQLRASSTAQRRALKRLRDKDIMWAIYSHDLRMTLSNNGIKPKEIPHKLLIDSEAEPL